MEFTLVYGALCTVTDCAWKKISNRLLMTGTAAGILIAAWQLRQGIRDSYGIFLALLPGLLLWGLARLTEGKIGNADGWLMLIWGLVLGWERSLSVLCTACLVMAIFAGSGLALGRFQKATRLPFAPFLLIGTALIWLLTLMGG